MIRRPLWIVIPAVLLGIALNGMIQLFQENFLEWPFFFDSIFTIVVGVFFGWLPGLLTGIGSNFFMELTHGWAGIYWPFFVVNAATGLCSGLMARYTKDFWTLSRQVMFILLLTLVNSILGAVIVFMVFGGMTGTLPDLLVSAFIVTGQSLFSSAFLVRILINLVDKGVPVLLIFISYRYLWPLLRRVEE